MNRQSRNNEDKARQRNIYAKKHLQSDLDAQRDMERVHLQTIRNEKIRLQKELERMRNKGQYMVKRHGVSNHTQRLLKMRFTNEQSRELDMDNDIDDGDQDNHDNENRARLGLPEIGQSKKNKYGEYLPKKVNTQELQLTREERLRERRRKEAEKHQEALVARVGKLADDFKEKQSDGAGHSLIRRRHSVSSPSDNSDAKSDGAQTSKSDSFYTVPRRGMSRTKTRTSSIDVSLTDAKTSVARRLLPAADASRDGDDGARDGAVSTRKISGHVMPIDVKKTNTFPKKAEDLVFDQDMFAPDGQVRTVHLLPDSEEAFKEAKKARYLRRKGSGAMEMELSVGEMFGNEDEDDQTI